MAAYVETIPTAMSPEEAFAYMANLENFPKWDPGTLKAVRVSGEGANAVYDVTVKGVVGSTVLRYHFAEYDAPRRFAIEATTPNMSTVDTIQVTPEGTGASVRYQATLQMQGKLGFLNPFIGLFFKRTVKKGAAGLRQALSGKAAP